MPPALVTIGRKQAETEDRLLEECRKLLTEIRRLGHTGRGVIEVNCNNGGMTSCRSALMSWVDRP